MESNGRYLPAPVDKLLSDFTTQNFPFTWNVQNNGVAVSLNISWTFTDQQRFRVRSIQNKPPSTLLRDSRRMAEFIEGKKHKNTKDEGNVTQVSSVSTNNPIRVVLKTNSVGTQTAIDCTSISVQTEQSSFSAKADKGSMCSLKPEFKESLVDNSNATSKCTSVQTLSDTSNETEISNDKNCAIEFNSIANQGGAVYKRRIKNGNNEYLLTYPDSKRNKWMPEDKLNSHTAEYIRTNRHRIRGPSTPCTRKYRNQTHAMMIEEQVKMHAKKTSDVGIHTVDITGKEVHAVKIIAENNRNGDPFDFSYTVQCADGKVAEVYLMSLPIDFDKVLQW